MGDHKGACPLVRNVEDGARAYPWGIIRGRAPLYVALKTARRPCGPACGKVANARRARCGRRPDHDNVTAVSGQAPGAAEPVYTRPAAADSAASSHSPFQLHL